MYEIVNSRERNPQILGRLFYGKQIVNWGLAASRLVINWIMAFGSTFRWFRARLRSLPSAPKRTASRKTLIMKKQIGQPTPVFFMGADFLGAEPTSDNRVLGAFVLLCLKESLTEGLHA